MNFWRPLVLSLCLSGCAGAVHESRPQPRSNYPDHWPPPMEININKSECPHIDGYYRSGGRSNSTIGERFSNPIFERSFFYLNDIADFSNSFEVRHDFTNRRIYFDILNRGGSILASDLYKRYARCESGWFVIESHQQGGSGDSPVQSSHRRTSFGIAQDGSLVINAHAEGVWRKFLVADATRVSNIWYRFEKTDENVPVERSSE